MKHLQGIVGRVHETLGSLGCPLDPEPWLTSNQSRFWPNPTFRTGGVHVQSWPNPTVPDRRRPCPQLADCCRSATGCGASG